jgi:hypothetical protein
MSSTPNPARLAEYESWLAQLIATRDAHRAEHDDQKVRLLNRRIRAQIRWIRKAQQSEIGGDVASKKSKVKSNRSVNHRAEAQARRQATRDLSPRINDNQAPGVE